MKGLIYKDITIFFRSIDKRLVLFMAGAIILLMFNIGVYTGLVASVMLALTIGMQNIISFAMDEKVNWKEYQLAMPVSAVSAVAGRYISVVCTLAVSLVGSILLNLLSSVVFWHFDIVVWGVSAAVSVIIPLLWTGICLPLTYWFGFRSAQTIRLIVIIPLCYFIGYFEDGAKFDMMANSMFFYMIVAGIAVAGLFVISMIISIVGYDRKIV